MTALRFKNDTEREFWERAIMAAVVMSPVVVTVQPQEKDPERPVPPPKASPADRADALTLLLRERMEDMSGMPSRVTVDSPIASLGIGSRAVSALVRSGLKTLGDLARGNPRAWVPGFGRRSAVRAHAALVSHGIVPEWSP